KNKEGDAAAYHSVRVISTLMTILAVVVSVLLLFFADVVTTWMAPGFDAEARKLSILLLRCFSVGGAGIILHKYYSSLHTCFFRYNAVAFAPLTFNMFIIISIVFFGSRVGVISLASGIALGYLAYFLTLFITLPKRAELTKPAFDWKDPGLRQYIWMLLPLYLAVSVEQVQLFVDRALASHLPEGSLSSQGYALRLVKMFADFIIAIFLNVLFPVFSSLAQSNKRQEFARQFSLTLQAVILLMAIAGSVMVGLALPGVRTILERGSFEYADSVRTAELIGLYFIAIGSQTLYIVISRGFNAHGDTRTPMITTIISVSVIIAADFALVGSMGIKGLALALAIGYSLNAVLMYLLFSRYLEAKHHWKNLRIFTIGIGLAVLLGWTLKISWDKIAATSLVDSFFLRTGLLTLISLLAVGLFLGALKVFKIEALGYILKKYRSRTKNKPIV
ncbi:polysaccharide biosynthesis C-terminal domain-containing protein, partial [bacterium]|nr:polysaccharide biosynthesis C-terminal domain-containing protein [bacterium]